MGTFRSPEGGALGQVQAEVRSPAATECRPGETNENVGRSSPRHAITPARHRDRNTSALCLERRRKTRNRRRLDSGSACRRRDGNLLARPLHMVASLPSAAFVGPPRHFALHLACN